MAADADPRLLQLAESISDRLPVAWGEVREAAGDLSPVVDGLERVQTLAEAFAASQVDGDPDRRTPPAARWGQLEILETLGRGAFGEVVRARDPMLDREVALKLHPAVPGPVDGAGRRLLDEARLLARIRHPNVVAVYGADLCDGRVGIWTELIDGRTLEQRLATEGPVSADEAVAIGRDLCRALAAIHANGLVHGDVKAANVIRERGGRIVLTDLGSATECGARPLTGSPATLAPEVLAGGPATAAADLYSLGLLLARLLTGAEPGTASNLRDLRPGLPEPLVRVLERTTAPEPEDRYPSAGALERALADSGRELPQTASQSPPPRADGRRLRRLVLRSSVAAVAAAAAAAAGFWLARGPSGSDTSTDRPPQTTAELDARIEPASPVAAMPTEASQASAHVAQAAAPSLPAPLRVEATMLRAGDQIEPLADGDRLRTGDRLALEIQAEEPINVWLVNEDLHGEVFLLFPIDGLDQGNPLAAGRRHLLPGRLRGVPQHWQVTSTGDRERFLVIASRHPLPELERELAGMAAARAGSAPGVTRGVGGLAPVALTGSGKLDVLASRLTEIRQRDGSVWIRRIELLNP